MIKKQILTYSVTLLIILVAAIKVESANFNIPSDTTIGVWNEETRTYTLKMDVYGYDYGTDIIEIEESNMTFNGDGHHVFIYVHDTAGYGIYIPGLSGITVKNLIVVGKMDSVFGLVSDGDNIFMNNSFEDCLIGLSVFSDDKALVFNNTFSNCYEGIYIDGLAYVYNNNFIDNFEHVFPVSNTIFNLDKPMGGNYWSDWTSPDANGDGFVDSPYLVYDYFGNLMGKDNLPWTVQDGWIKPEVQIEQLIMEVESLTLQQGISDNLVSKLNAAKRALDDLNENNDGAAVNALGAFINAVEAQRGNKISDIDADALISSAQQIIDLLTNG